MFVSMPRIQLLLLFVAGSKNRMWDPFKEIEDAFRRISPGLAAGRMGFFSPPPMDLYEQDNRFVLSADLPGMKKEDMEVNVRNNTVCIKSQRQLPPVPKGTNNWPHCAERPFGKFERCFELPARIKEDSIAASYVDGVLEVVLEKEKAGVSSGSRSISIS